MKTPDYRIQLESAHSGFDGEWFWGHARPGRIGDRSGSYVITTQRTLRSGSDLFYTIHHLRTDDDGKTWSDPKPHEGLSRRQEPDGVDVNMCDPTPTWHEATQTLLCTGHTVRYSDNKVMHVRTRETAYTIYDPAADAFTPWRTVEMPDEPFFKNGGAGSTQRVDLADGTILLPIYCKRPEEKCHNTTVLRCAFDGKSLSYIEHGPLLSLDVPRGYCEPSLTRWQDSYFLTLRNDVTGYVTSGRDGLNFDPPRPWTFDDGENLGNYNTQQHWVTHPDGLFLVYTRRGADNDHVFRHRAPLFIGQVDPERLCVLRDTERILVPERGARLGNFGVCQATADETWVVVSEWMQPVGCEEHGSDNTIWVARLFWQ